VVPERLAGLAGGDGQAGPAVQLADPAADLQQAPSQILKNRLRKVSIVSGSPDAVPPWMRWKQVNTQSLGVKDRLAGAESEASGS
jgi:hypothetical protein